MVDADHRLNDDVVDPGPHQAQVNPHLLQMCVEGGEALFVPNIVFIDSCVLNELITFFIDTVISEMYVATLGIAFMFVLLCGEPSKSFIEYVHSQGIEASDEDVESNVEFESVDEKWVTHVPAYNAELINWDIRDIIHQVDSPAS